MAMFAGALPLPGGLGGFEAALHGLYSALMPAGAPAGQGFVVALAYRLVTILVAVIGIGFYLSERREVAELVHAAEEEEAEEAKKPAPKAGAA